MKKMLLISMMLWSSVAWSGGLEEMLKQMVITKIVEKNPGAGEIIRVLLPPRQCKVSQDGVVLEPTSVQDCIEYGRALGKMGRLQEATNYLNRTLSLDPENLDAHYYLGMVYAKLGNKNAALAEYDIMQRIIWNRQKKAERLLHRINAAGF